MKRAFAVFACLLLQIPAPAWAGDPPSAEAEEARKLFAQGNEAYYKENWSECRKKLLGAWGKVKQWQIALNLGTCELRLGIHRDAAEHLSYGLRELPADTAAATRAEVKTMLDEATSKIVTLTFALDPPDAEVRIDGKSLGSGPFNAPTFLDVATYAIEIRAEGRKPFKESITGRAGLRQDVAHRLDPVPAPPQKRPPIPREAAKEPGLPVIQMVIGGAAAALAIGVGAGLTVAANGESADAQALQDRSACGSPAQDAGGCDELSKTLSAKDRLSRGALASFVIGGVVALGTASFVVSDRLHARGGTKVRAAAVIGKSEGGVVVVGSW